jgi:hypothetical protein
LAKKSEIQTSNYLKSKIQSFLKNNVYAQNEVFSSSLREKTPFTLRCFAAKKQRRENEVSLLLFRCEAASLLRYAKERSEAAKSAKEAEIKDSNQAKEGKKAKKK